VCAVTLFSLSLFLQPTQLNPHSVVVFNARLLKKGLNYCYCLTPVAPVFAIIIIPIVGCKAAAAYAVQPSPCGGGGGTGTSPYGSCVLLLLLHPSPVHWLLVEQLFCHLFFALGVVVVVVVLLLLVVLLEAVVSVGVLVFVGGRRNSFEGFYLVFLCSGSCGWWVCMGCVYGSSIALQGAQVHFKAWPFSSWWWL
jgi:hypothetical protein